MAYKMKKGATAMYGPKAIMDKKGPMAMSGEKYDAKEAYNKNLTASARLHYLENERHDKTHMSKVQPHKRGVTAMMNKKGSTAMMDKKGAMAMSKTEKGIKGLGSSNKSEGKYI